MRVKGSRFQLKQAARKTSQAATSLYNQGKCQKYDSVYNNLWLSSSFCLKEVMEMITVLSDCYYCCVKVQCVCAGNQGMLVFIIQIHKIFLLPRFAREGAVPPHPPPRVALRHALFRFFHHGAPPLSFSGSAPEEGLFKEEVQQEFTDMI